MQQTIGGFIISIVTVAAATRLAEGLLPGGEQGKSAVRYLISLAVLLTVLSPIAGLAKSLSALELAESDIFELADVEAIARVNSIRALHVARSVADKFGYDEDEISAELEGEILSISLPKRLGVLESDLRDFILSGWGLEARVVLE